jgi:hypothetical protein
MHDESINQEPLNQKAALQAALELRLVRALDAAPPVDVPADFAARVARRLPVRRRPESITTTHYGDTTMFLGMMITLFALAALTFRSGGHPTFGLIESLLLAQFLALAVWLSIRRLSMR